MRIFWLALGWVALALGAVGVVLPLLPTTPFLIVAAFAFGKSSPALRARLMDHPRFGPPLRDWETRGAIARRYKTLAVAMMGAAFALSVALGLEARLLIIQAVCLGAAALFVISRPG